MPHLHDPFRAHLAQTSSDPDGLEVGSALGARVTDSDGRVYLDFLAGIGVCNTGHRHPAVLDAVRAQLDRHLHVMVFGEWMQEAPVRLAERLAALAPFSDAQVYFGNSGAEGVEGALKLARKATGRQRIVAFAGSYHGDTFGALSVLGVEFLRAPFAPLLPGIAFRPFGDEKGLAAVNPGTAAVIVEPIQAEGGVRIPPDEFLPALRRKCDEVGALLILDEVQTGLGRTGTLWAGSHWQVVPDILVLAKALGGGLPLGAFLAPRKIMKTLATDPPLSHLTTFGGHPLSCAAGLAALDLTLAEGLPARAAALGTRFRDAMEKLRSVGWLTAVRGKGLLVGLELPTGEKARLVVTRCRERGLITGCALHDERVLRLTPPLTLTDAELDEGLAVLTTAISS